MESHFGIWDFVVLISILIIFAIIGIYYRFTGGRQKTTREYLMADRSMNITPVAFSLVASFMSAVSLLGVSSESYHNGVIFAVITLGYFVNSFIISYIYLPVFYRMRTTSVYEYLERRFGHTTRLVASLAYSVQMVLYMGIVLYAPSLALEAVTGIDQLIAMLIIGIVCTFYATIGGLKAVLITELLQAILMFGAIFVVIGVAMLHAGGFMPIWQHALDTGRINFLNFSVDPTERHSWFSLIIGGMIVHLSIYGVNQTQIQRMLTVGDLKSARASILWSTPILAALIVSTLFSGLAMLHFYQNCDPVLAGRIKTGDQLMPLFAIDTMNKYPGLCGLFVSGIFSASISSVASAISSLAAVSIEDYIKPLYRKLFERSMLEEHALFLSKILAGAFGIICILLAYTASSLGGMLQASLTIFGVVGGPLLALFTLGMLTVKTNQRGVLLGFLCGLLFACFLGFGGPKPAPTYLPLNINECSNNYTDIRPSNTISEQTTQYYWIFKLSYLWYSVLGFSITAFIGYFSSYLLEYLNLARNDQVYTNVSQDEYNCELFADILARKLRSKQYKESTKLKNVIYSST